jgi:outer membrane phospholipase A
MTSYSRANRLLHAVVLVAFLPALVQAQTRGAVEPDDIPSPRAAAARQERTDILNFVRAYEPVKLGLTRDAGDELFMDFTLSLMFPLLGDYWDAPAAGEPWWGKRDGLFNSQHTALFLSGTVRAGQYVWGRPSAPVVEKRFNPQLFLRFWLPVDGRESANKFLDVIYAHESNGQSITTADRFQEQREVYRKLEADPDSPLAYDRSLRSARDAISRGWDYVGVNASWSWREERHIAMVKVREYLPWGFLQQDAEQSNDWEGDGPTHRRRDYDGLTLQYTVFENALIDNVPFLTGRTTFTYTTGLSRPGRHNTFELDLGVALWRRPFSLWVRYGYNSNLTNYYRRDHSVGGGIAIWSFF